MKARYLKNKTAFFSFLAIVHKANVAALRLNYIWRTAYEKETFHSAYSGHGNHPDPFGMQ